MPYLVTSPLVLVKVPDQVGDGYRVDYHYRGDVVPWLSDEQAEHFLSEGLVVELSDDDPAAEDGAKPPKNATKPVLAAWVVAHVAKDDGSDYTAEELDAMKVREIRAIIDSVE